MFTRCGRHGGEIYFLKSNSLKDSFSVFCFFVSEGGIIFFFASSGGAAARARAGGTAASGVTDGDLSPAVCG